MDSRTKAQLRLQLYHEKTDRLLAKAIFNNHFPEYKLIDNPYKMGIDLLIYPIEMGSQEAIGGVDVERQTFFRGDRYITKMNAVSIPARKARFFRRYPLSFWLCLDWTYNNYILLSGEECLNGKHVSTPTYMGGQDNFIYVEKNKVTIHRIPNDILKNKKIMRSIRKVLQFEEENMSRPEYTVLRAQLQKIEKKLDQTELF